MKKIFSLMAILAFLFVFAGCSDVTNLTDTKAVEPIPDGMGQISISLPTSSNNPTSRAVDQEVEFTDAETQTDGYAVTVYNATTTITRLYYPNQGYAEPIFIEPGTYNMIVLAGKRNDTNDKLTAVYGTGSNYNIVVNAGLNTSLTTILAPVQYGIGIIGNEEDPNEITAYLQYWVSLQDLPGVDFEYRATSGDPQVLVTMSYDVSSGFPIPKIVQVETQASPDVPCMGGLIRGYGRCDIPSNAVGTITMEYTLGNGTAIYLVDSNWNREFTLGDLALAPDDLNIGAMSNYGSNIIQISAGGNPVIDVEIKWY